MKRCITLSVLSLLAAPVWAVDSDQDGLSDAVEKQLGTDPQFFDSNINGISDFDEAYAKKRIDANGDLLQNRSEAGQSITTGERQIRKDSDGDGIEDLFESFGYTYDGFIRELYAVARQFSPVEWQAFRSTVPAGLQQGITNPYELVASTMEQNGYLEQFVTEDGSKYYSVDIVNAMGALHTAFVDTYGADHIYVNGSSNKEGALNFISRQLLNSPILPPFDASGNRLTVFFTDPTRVSSDTDPYSDWDEVTHINPLTVKPPADHPLVAAYPVVQANLLEYGIILNEEFRESNGGSKSETRSQTITHTNGSSNTVGHEVGAEVKLKAKGFKSLFLGPEVEVAAKYAHKWSTTTTTSRAEANGVSNQLGINWSNTSVTSNAEAAYLELGMRFTNVGSAPAADIEGRLNVYLGGDLIHTQDNIKIGTLNFRGTTQTDFLVPVNGDRIILSAEELRAFDAGAEVALSFEVTYAGVINYNSDVSLIDGEEDWVNYIQEAQSKNAKLSFHAINGFGNQINESHVVYAGDYPILPIGEAAKLVKGESSVCSGAVILCLGKEKKEAFSVTEKTGIGIIGFDTQGDLISDAGMGNYLGSDEDLDVLFDLPVEKGWEFYLVNSDSSVPEMVISGLEVNANGYVVKTVVRDDIGLHKVRFCLEPDQCEPMLLQLSQGAEIGLGSATLKLNLPHSVRFNGNESIEVINTRGQRINGSPELLHDTYISTEMGLVWGLNFKKELLEELQNQNVTFTDPDFDLDEQISRIVKIVTECEKLQEGSSLNMVDQCVAEGNLMLEEAVPEYEFVDDSIKPVSGNKAIVPIIFSHIM